MNNNTNKKAQIDGVCKAGAIITIISAASIMFILLICAIVVFAAGAKVKDITSDTTANKLGTGSAVIMLIAGLFQLLPLIFCIRLLKGKAKSNIAAGVFALFSGVLGGILILVGKYNLENDVAVNSENINTNIQYNNQS